MTRTEGSTLDALALVLVAEDPRGHSARADPSLRVAELLAILRTLHNTGTVADLDSHAGSIEVACVIG